MEKGLYASSHGVTILVGSQKQLAHPVSETPRRNDGLKLLDNYSIDACRAVGRILSCWSRGAYRVYWHKRRTKFPRRIIIVFGFEEYHHHSVDELAFAQNLPVQSISRRNWPMARCYGSMGQYVLPRTADNTCEGHSSLLLPSILYGEPAQAIIVRALHLQHSSVPLKMWSLALAKLFLCFFSCLDIVESQGQPGNLVECSPSTLCLIQKLDHPISQTSQHFDEAVPPSRLNLGLSLDSAFQPTVPPAQFIPFISLRTHGNQVAELSQSAAWHQFNHENAYAYPYPSQLNDLVLQTHTNRQRKQIVPAGTFNIESHFYNKLPIQDLSSSSCINKRKWEDFYNSESQIHLISNEQNNSLHPLAGQKPYTIPEGSQSEDTQDISISAVVYSQEISLYTLEDQKLVEKVRTFVSLNTEETGRHRFSIYNSLLKKKSLYARDFWGRDKRYSRITQTVAAEIYLGQTELSKHTKKFQQNVSHFSTYITENFPGDNENFQWLNNVFDKIYSTIFQSTLIAFANIRLISEAYYPPFFNPEELRNAQLELWNLLEHIWILVFLKEGQETGQTLELKMVQSIRKRFRFDHHPKERELLPIAWSLIAAYMRLKLKGVPEICWNDAREFSKSYKAFIGARANFIRERFFDRTFDSPWRLESSEELESYRKLRNSC
ncbi:hypothetical protein O181_034961 [Austropuccinia psidii MF-1]|uniref:Uncharacterized protein n=1 Tax=Austropuccinia psidii MF-1 TaxID=1389203 RepID=A0A9Q3D7E3_9BASI|nr:hypothetical protein [Austropuccinia psidii MF-1]